MPDFRCYCDSELPEGSLLTLTADESNHLVAANRARRGDPARVFNGRGIEAEAVLAHADKRAATLQLLKRISFPLPSSTIALAQALPKGKLMESIIAKATEVGIQAIHPLLSERVEVKLEGAKKEAVKASKWQAAAIEAAKQSGNPFLPAIGEPQSLPGFLSTLPPYDLKLLASLQQDTIPLRAAFSAYRERHGGRSPRSVCWLIGPEGDFSEDESDSAVAHGFQPVTLGANVLRCETAAVCALAITRHEVQDG